MTFYFDVNVARCNDVNLACYNDDVEHSVNLISFRVTGTASFVIVPTILRIEKNPRVIVLICLSTLLGKNRVY